MKKLILSTITAVTIMASGFTAKAVTYGDSTGENIFNSFLDITSVEVTHTATDLNFKINLAGDPVATDWGKYMIGIDSVLGGDTAGNGWSRPIGMSSGMDYWVGTWVDGGNGAEVRSWGGASWGLQSATYGSNPDAVSVSKDSSSVTIQFKYAGLGITPGNAFCFDVYTSAAGGGDGAIDALANPNQTIANWGDYYNSGSLYHTYTIPVVPEPTATGLLLGGVALMFVNSIRRKA